jgi:hypothetical protein
MIAKLLITALALQSLAFAIELKPEFFETDIEQGIKVPELALPDGQMKVVYSYPTKWRTTTGTGEISFAHPEFLHTTLAIRLAAAGTLGEDEIKSRTEWLATFAPKEATEFTVEKAQRSDLVVNNFPVLDLAASYSAFGQKYRVAVFVVYATTGTMEFVLIAPGASFEKTFETIRQSLFSLRWEPASAVESAKVQAR